MKNQNNKPDQKLQLDNAVSNLLMNICIPTNVKGFRYLKTALIEMVYDDSLLFSLTTKLYPLISKKYNTSDEAVETAIRHAISYIHERASLGTILEFYNCDYYTTVDQFSTSEFLSCALERINNMISRGEVIK